MRTTVSNGLILSLITTWLFVVTLTACGGPGASLGSTPNFSQSRTAGPLASASPTPIPFSFTTVDDPNSAHNQVTGINQRGKIVGTFGVGSQSNIPSSYTSQTPYTKFRSVNYPGAQGTVATSISSTRTIGGYVIDPNSQSGISGLLQINGLANLVVDTNEGSGSDAVTEVLGVNDSGLAVGFYMNASGQDVPFELNIAQDTFTDLTPPGAPSAQATGINNKGNVTGIETSSSGISGWYMRGGTYYPIVYPGASETEALSLNHQEQVVGFYAGGGGKTHGFVLTGPTNGGDQQIWQTVDEPNAADTTVITGINNHDAICGYYTDASGAVHGFVATVKSK